jgi:dTDP-4-amino-4,6-dideoxygalactose transaminase
MTQLLTPTPVPFARTTVTPEAVDAVTDVLKSGWLTSGPQVAEFEQEIAAYVDAPHAIAVSSCTAALELALRALRLAPGSRVLTPTLTFCGAVNAIIHAGLTPVFVDLDPATMMPTAETTAAAAALGPVHAMVVLHYAGHPAPVEELADAAGLPLGRVVEDAAHALGTRVGDRPVGGISAATCFSFYATKNLPIGEGGMVTTADEDIADQVRRARLHGMSKDAWKRYLPGAAWRYEVGTLGLKANMTDIQAAIGRSHLRAFDGWQARRAELVARYDERLAGLAGVRRPERPESGAGTHAWHLYVIRVLPDARLTRDELIGALSERGIGTSVHFIPNHQQPYYRDLVGSAMAEYPAADQVAEEILSLPLHPALADHDVDHVTETLAELLEAPRTNDHLGKDKS